MAMIRHPLNQAEYYRVDDDTVRVVGKDGVEGVFNRRGNWISGEKRTADAALCMYVADGFLKDLPPGTPPPPKP